MSTPPAIGGDGTLTIGERVERLPLSRFHAKLAGALGTATFFDGFDALTIAFILPVLIREWQLTPAMAGILIAAGYAGQALGAVLFGVAAQRWGRVPAITWAIGLFSVTSVLCAIAPSYWLLVAARAVQGVGLGGEMPVAATYIGEMIGGRKRGRLFFFYQSSFGVGILAASATAALLLPDYGWRWMFWAGALPILLIPLIFRYCPESPQWLAARGRCAEAENVVTAMEQGCGIAASPVLPRAEMAVARPEVVRLSELLSSSYRRITLNSCLLWAIAAVGLYGLGVWTPTILTGYYQVSIRDALVLGAITGAGVAVTPLTLAFVSEHLSRTALLLGTFAVSALLLLPMGLGLIGTTPKGAEAGILFVSICIAQLTLTAASATLYLYTSELYPVHLRTLGTGLAAACQRTASIVAPLIIAGILAQGSPHGVFLFLALAAAAGAFCVRVAGNRRDTDGDRSHPKAFGAAFFAHKD